MDLITKKDVSPVIKLAYIFEGVGLFNLSENALKYVQIILFSSVLSNKIALIVR